MRARGELGRAAIAAPGTAINYMQPEYRVEGDTLLVGFGPDSALLDPGDEAAVLAAAAHLYPDTDLVAAHGHDWVADEFAKGTWSMYRPGQLTGSLRELQRPEGRVVFAGSGRRERLERLRRRGHRERPVGLADGSCADRRRWPVVCRQ